MGASAAPYRSPVTRQRHVHQQVRTRIYQELTSTLQSANTADLSKSSQIRVAGSAEREIAGVGPVFAAVFVAEIGDVTRFDNPRRLCSWAGLTPRHRESDSHVRRGAITKQGSALVRWTAVEAISARNCEPCLAAIKSRVGQRRGRGVGRVAAARHLLTLVFSGMRDGHIRCLAANAAA